MAEKTIAAISTAMAPGGIGIVRLSGPEARQIADKVFRSKSGKPVSGMKGYTAMLGSVHTSDGEKLDDAVALMFSAPKSYTGEDVVELSIHGGIFVTKQLLRKVLDAGAFPAGPGEFTKRAFLNGKMDLAQAEAVMRIVSAGGEQAVKAAAAGTDGALSRRVAAIRNSLSGLGAHLAAWADFPEEDVPELGENELRSGLLRAEEELSRLMATYDQGKIYREGVETVIAGKPNVGKSTLMNLLAGCQRSIVTQYAGTTRDVVEETVLLGDIPLRLADTAGLRETEDPVESIGVSVARERLSRAQLVLAVFDASQPLSEEDLTWMEELDPSHTVAVVNKTDLDRGLDESRIQARFPHTARVSAALGQGVDRLKAEVADLLDAGDFQPEAGVLFTERQRADGKRALDAVREALQALDSGFTLDAVTVCVDDALNALYLLTGERASDEVIDRVFEEFCVGK